MKQRRKATDATIAPPPAGSDDPAPARRGDATRHDRRRFTENICTFLVLLTGGFALVSMYRERNRSSSIGNQIQNTAPQANAVEAVSLDRKIVSPVAVEPALAPEVPKSTIQGGGSGTVQSVFPPEGHWRCYFDLNPDLLDHMNNTKEAAERHWTLHGVKEGRNCRCEGFYCCGLELFEDAGQALTENVADLYRCGGMAHFVNGEEANTYPVYRQVMQVAKLFGSQISGTRMECIKHYRSKPSMHPPGKTREAMYSLLANTPERGWRYDGISAARTLRKAQAKILSSCGFEAPHFNDIDISTGKGSFEQLATLSPSKTVFITVRRAMRQLLNTEQILSTCVDFKLDCQMFDASQFFDQEENREDICHVLRQFGEDSPLVIGAQGAEMIYPLLFASRLFLVTGAEQLNGNRTSLGGPIVDSRRFGNATRPGEVQCAHNLIRNGNAQHFDPFFPEFGAIFGADLTPIRATVDKASLEARRDSAKKQCKKGVFCADLTVNITDVRAELKWLIDGGQLLQKK